MASKDKKLNSINPPTHDAEIKGIKARLEDAKLKLAAAQKANDEKKIKFYQQSIANLTGTIERNS